MLLWATVLLDTIDCFSVGYSDIKEYPYILTLSYKR